MTDSEYHLERDSYHIDGSWRNGRIASALATIKAKDRRVYSLSRGFYDASGCNRAFGFRYQGADQWDVALRLMR